VKVIRFHRGGADDVRAAWSRAVGRPGRPARATWATPVTGGVLLPSPFAAVEVTWWDTADATVGATGLDRQLRLLDAGLVPRADPVVLVVDEVVGRGADALAARWADGATRPKMMSVGRRSSALSRADFAQRWRRDAGTFGGERIPDDVRGIAYVQDHPVAQDEPPFDSVNEVWFDSVDHLRARAAWLAARPIPADLMDPSTCATLCLLEDVLTP
jgi:hypothetical protein